MGHRLSHPERLDNSQTSSPTPGSLPPELFPNLSVAIMKKSQKLSLLTRLYRRIVPQRVPAHPFDRINGTDTGGFIRNQRAANPHATAYWGTAPSLLRGSFVHWSETLNGTPYSTADYTFIDLGSGKGRVLMLASELPFRHIAGVELDPALVAASRLNLALWNRPDHVSSSIEVIHGDAVDVALPEEPVLLYLYNPFDADLVSQLADRLRSLLRARIHPVDIIYTRPDHARLFEAVPGIQTLWKGEIPFSPEDTAADIFDTTQQQCFIYRLSPRS